MPQLPQKLDTTANQLAKNYSPASTVKIAPVADTTVVATDIRTVVTRSTQGTLELRYTPRDPSPVSAKTAP